MRLGIMSAMNEEIKVLVSELRSGCAHRSGMREYHSGSLWGCDAVLAFSRWGKVAAASTATELISKHGVEALIFTGVAGGVAPGLSAGDIVVGTELWQHDMDARPLFERHEVPLLGRSSFAADPMMREKLERASREFLAAGIEESMRREFGIVSPKAHLGEIASGDQFFASAEKVAELRSRLPGVLCVEMEGAAVAQVCHEHGIPFAIVRTVSDSADEHAPVDFPHFVREVASVYSHGILRGFVRQG